ncbi:MAG: site-2 protease family protein [Mycobacteriales bacterium]
MTRASWSAGSGAAEVLYALGHPASFLVLALSFVVGITLHGWVQAIVADRMGDRRPRLARRLEPQPQVHIDPFGAVGALIGGLGWAHPVELGGRRDRARTIAVALAGPLVNIVLGLALLVLYRGTLATGPSEGLAAFFADQGAGYALQHGGSLAGDVLGYAVLLAGASQLYLGVLSLVPLPPLDGGRLLFALAPRTLGWQRAEHYLVEQNIGVAVVLLLLLLPLGGRLLLLQVLDSVLAPLLGLVLGV